MEYDTLSINNYLHMVLCFTSLRSQKLVILQSVGLRLIKYFPGGATNVFIMNDCLSYFTLCLGNKIEDTVGIRVENCSIFFPHPIL